MVRTEPIIAVNDVSLSSHFYQQLLGCQGKHGGDTFEILTDENVVILCLHRWGEHCHPTMMKNQSNNQNGLILFFRVDNLHKVYQNAKVLNATIEEGIHYNQESLKYQFVLRDLDNYYLIISE